MQQTVPPPTIDRVADVVLAPAPPVPDAILAVAATLLVDTLGVAAAAVPLPAGRIARDTALDLYGAGRPGLSAPLLFDGRRASLAGAAFALASQIDNLDAHDGYNPTKGHIGCAMVPALFAVAATLPALSGRDALTAMVIGYEVAARAALALHATAPDYHTSGAWNGLGVAAMAVRLAGDDRAVLRQALGIAEYHGPRSQMMREIDNPTMLHDGSGMGALVGLSAWQLARRGFAGAPAITVEAPEVAGFWADLGQTWTTGLNYIKPYPTCRWAHAALDAAWHLRRIHGITGADVVAVEVRTFAEAARLYQGVPQTTSQAQYGLSHVLAAMLQYGTVSAGHIQGDGLRDPAVAALAERITVVEDARHSRRFPAGRWSDITIILTDGRRLDSGDVQARGGPEAPMAPDDIRGKFDALCRPVIGAARAARIWDSGHGLVRPEARFADLAALVVPPPEAAA